MNDPYQAGSARPLSRLCEVAILTASFAYFGAMAWLFQRRLETMRPLALTDFNDYHVVGRMVLSGRAAQAYDWTALKAEQVAQTGAWDFMPWAYPPPFTLLTGIFGPLPLWAAYLLFTGATFLLFYTALRRLAGGWTPWAMLAVLPAILINGKCGQSGFLSAGLIGWFLIGLRDGSARAGIGLGGMIIKPHLALGIGLLTLLERRWRTLAIAALVVATLAAVSTLALGPAIWPAFQQGTAFSSQYLWLGEFPLERMSTTFAMLHRFGVAPGLALALHLAVAAGALAVFLLAWRRDAKRSYVLALSVCVSLILSPYTYDYDLVSLAFVAALILPDLLQRARWGETLAALGLTWIATSNFLFIGVFQFLAGVDKIDNSMKLWTISPLSFAALAVLVAAVLRRPPSAGRVGAYPARP